MSGSEILDETYERLRRTGPEFGGDEEGNNGLTNHGPMAAEVIVRRNLDLDVHSWIDAYLPRLVELPSPSAPITDEDWKVALGNAKRIADWTEYFTRQVTELPWRDVLTTWWPRLLPGIVAGATHGVIRVGHAVRTLLAGNESQAAQIELAHGLAFWAGRSRLVPGLSTPTGEFDATSALDAVPHLADQSGVLASRIPRLATVPGWSESVAAIRRPVDDHDVPARLAELVDAASIRYLNSAHGSPVLLLHTATAPNAVLHTLPVLPSELWQPSFAAVWGASAAIVAMYAPATAADDAALPAAPADSATDANPVAEVLQRTAENSDEHMLKFADTAVEAYERTGNPDTLRAALRAEQLVGH
ncbi:questin oxidase family protein [Kribbella sp. NPDC050241]|uniref:questin oxidase family protein n=1 Tax=Kribbella sp. NPDC050241 TaxID=3364115 RepID=UPI0037B90AAC